MGEIKMSEFEFAINSAKLIAKELQERQMNRPDEYQERVYCDGSKFGLKYPIVGFLDFSYHKNYDMVVDIKTTKRVPTVANSDHILQQALYWKLTGETRRFALLYASDKRVNFIEISKQDLERAWATILFNMKFIERLDERCQSKKDWALSFPYPDLNSFYFSDKGFKQKITELYEELI